MICLFQLILILEVLCRIFPLPDTLAGNPGVRHFWPDWVYHPLNNAGYREKNFQAEKPKHIYRIFIVGDSFVEGAGLSRNQTIGSLLEQEINTRLQQLQVTKRVEVFNMGHCGDNLPEEFLRVKENLPIYDPDLVIMTYFHNDAEEHAPSNKNKISSPIHTYLNQYLLGIDGSYLWYRLLDLENIWSSGNPKYRYIDYVLSLHQKNQPGWIKAQKAMDEMLIFFKHQSTDWLYIIWPFFLPGDISFVLRNLNHTICETMKSKGIEAYDMLPFYLSHNQHLEQFAFSKRDAHSNAYAHQLLSKFLADLIFKKSSFIDFFLNNTP